MLNPGQWQIYLAGGYSDGSPWCFLSCRHYVLVLLPGTTLQYPASCFTGIMPTLLIIDLIRAQPGHLFHSLTNYLTQEYPDHHRAQYDHLFHSLSHARTAWLSVSHTSLVMCHRAPHSHILHQHSMVICPIRKLQIPFPPPKCYLKLLAIRTSFIN